MAKRRDGFVVGGARRGEAMWGRSNGYCGKNAFCPATAIGVMGILRQYEGEVCEKGFIYRLVPVSVAEVERQAARERKARGKRKGGVR